jgi:hypothetical protein
MLSGERHMKIELFVSASFFPCRDAEHIWAAAANAYNSALVVLDVNGSGKERAQALGINLVPALAIDGTLRAIGVQTLADAKRLLDPYCRK